MADMRLLRAVACDLTQFHLQTLVLQILPGINWPRGSTEKLTGRLLDWVQEDIDRRYARTCETVAYSLSRDRLAMLLRGHCHIKILPNVKKPALAARLLAELRKDAHCDVTADQGKAFVDDADATGDIVAVEPGRRLRRRFHKTWVRGARKLNRKMLSGNVKQAIATYCLALHGKKTLLQVRREVADKVGHSLESGHKRAIFERQLARHLERVFAPSHASKRVLQNRERKLLAADETARMRYEDVMSEMISCG